MFSGDVTVILYIYFRSSDMFLGDVTLMIEICIEIYFRRSDMFSGDATVYYIFEERRNVFTTCHCLHILHMFVLHIGGDATCFQDM
jgi:hypothetical protein